jgi:hypothetical protein
VEAYSPSGGVEEIVSFSAPQVTSLLRALELHRDMFQVGHEEARRLTVDGRRRAYLLDFELIYRFAFRAEERPDWANEISYLLGRHDTPLLIGPGTQFEIEQFRHVAGFTIGADGAPVPARGSHHSAFGLDSDTVKIGLLRISQLLNSPNIVLYEDLIDEVAVNEKARETAKAALDLRRRGKHSSPYANTADAFNWAAVAYLREEGPTLGVDFYPYLLTATRSLLEDSSWGAEIQEPISRRPADAIYTEVLLDFFPNPERALQHTNDMPREASALEEELRSTPAYLHPERYLEDPEWESAVAHSAVAEDLRRQLEGLAQFISDPVVTETQRIYDNARLAAADARLQRQTALTMFEESPRKLFDLIIEVNAALKAKPNRSGLGGLWKAVLKLQTDGTAPRISYRLIEKDATRRPTEYIAAEHYLELDHEGDGGPLDQVVLRWPTSSDADSILETFCRAYRKHDIRFVDLIAGTDRNIHHLEAELPITVADLLEVLSQDDAGEDEEPECPVRLRWIRMSGKTFDLYADVFSTDPARGRIIGIFADAVNPAHLEDLYSRTSSRYLLPVWLRRALGAIREASERASRDFSAAQSKVEGN